MRKTTDEIPTGKKKTAAKAPKLSSSKKLQLKKAQDAGGLSSVAVSHTSKAKIFKSIQKQ